MDGKYIIILLFIFFVFLMGSINSTVTNNFYNNTTGSQDHAVLTNLSYADSNHTGFQSSDTLDDDVSSLGYVTNNTGNFLPLSGGNLTGKMTINVSGELNSSSVSERIFEVGNPNGVSVGGSYIRKDGIQYWNITNDVGYMGYVGYANPGNYPAIIFGKPSASNAVPALRFQGEAETGGVGIRNNYNFTVMRNLTVVQNITVSALAGSGNAYDCLDANGKHYRGSPTC